MVQGRVIPGNVRAELSQQFTDEIEYVTAAEVVQYLDLATQFYECPVCRAVVLTSLPYAEWRPEDPLPAPPYEEAFGTPSYEVCACCGFEFGNDDNPGTAQPVSFDAYRRRWVEQGRPLFGDGRYLRQGAYCRLR